MEHEVGGEVGVDLVLPFACHLELFDPDESGNEFVSAAVPGDHGPSLVCLLEATSTLRAATHAHSNQ
jgi:hypothetical protein